MPNVKRKTVSGIKWLVGSSIFQKMLSFMTMVVLARILEPKDFGMFALAFIAIDALGLFKSLGIDIALVRRKDEDIDRAANTAFFMVPALGFILFFVMFAGAPYIARFLGDERIMGVLQALGLIFVFNCMGKIPGSLLERKMEFKKVMVREVIAAILYSATSITLALMGFGIWSLVIGYLVKTSVESVTIWILSKWRPRFEFDKRIALQLIHFGKFLFLSSLVWFLKKNLDNLFVGKLIGVTALGYYAIAHNISNFCVDYFGTRVNRVIFPAYAQMQDNPQRLKAAILKTFKFVAIFVIPFGVILSVLSTELITFIYGDKWRQAADVLVILAWAGIFNTLPSSLNAVFMVNNKTHYTFILNLIQVSLFLLFIGPAAKAYGLQGVGVVVTMASLVTFVATIRFVTRNIQIGLLEIIKNIKVEIIAVSIMAGVIFLIKQLFTFADIQWVNSLSAIILSLMAIIVYFFIIYKKEKETLIEMKDILLGSKDKSTF